MQVKYTFSITIIAEDLHPSVVPGGARAGGGAGVGAVLHQLRVALGLERLPGNLDKEEVREVNEKRRITRLTCSTTSLHSCLVAGRHFLVLTLAHSSSSTNLVTGTWTRPHTSWGEVLQTCRATVLSLHTCTRSYRTRVRVGGELRVYRACCSPAWARGCRPAWRRWCTACPQPPWCGPWAPGCTHGGASWGRGSEDIAP